MLEPKVDLYTVAIPPPRDRDRRGNDDPCLLYKCLNMDDMIQDMSLYSLEHIDRLGRMSVLDTEVDGSNPGSSMLFP